jgi:hypothetical protein
MSNAAIVQEKPLHICAAALKTGMFVACYRALVTWPERIQRVQTLTVIILPFFTALTFCRFGYHTVRVLLLAWLTLLPKLGPFPQTSHFLDILLFLQLIAEKKFIAD